jgi:hypothetical protein
MVILRCHGCGSEKEVSTAPKEYVCRDCGCVNVVVQDTSAPEACGCIPPAAWMGWNLPAGVHQDPMGTLWYVTAQGTEMTAQEFIEAFGFDPAVAHERMLKLGREGIPGFENLSTLGKRKAK